MNGEALPAPDEASDRRRKGALPLDPEADEGPSGFGDGAITRRLGDAIEALPPLGLE